MRQVWPAKLSDSGIDVDLGASWVHGAKENPIAKLAKKEPLCLIPKKTLVIRPDGNAVPPELYKRASEHMWGLIDDAFDESNRKGTKIRPTKSLKDYFTEKLADEPKDFRDLVMNLAEQWGGFIGDPWDMQSLRWFWLEECPDGGGCICISWA